MKLKLHMKNKQRKKNKITSDGKRELNVKKYFFLELLVTNWFFFLFLSELLRSKVYFPLGTTQLLFLSHLIFLPARYSIILNSILFQ